MDTLSFINGKIKLILEQFKFFIYTVQLSAGNFVDYVYRNEQSVEEMFQLLGYK